MPRDTIREVGLFARRPLRGPGALLLVAALMLAALAAGQGAAADGNGQSNFFQSDADKVEGDLSDGASAPCHPDSKPVIEAYLNGAAGLNPPSNTCQVVTALGACQYNMGVSQDRDRASCCLFADRDDPACQSLDDDGNPAAACNTCTSYPWMEKVSQTLFWTSCEQAVQKLPAKYDCPAPSDGGAIGDMGHDVMELEADQFAESIGDILEYLF